MPNNSYIYYFLLIVGLFYLLTVATTTLHAEQKLFEVYDSKSKKIIACQKTRGRWEAGGRIKNGRKFVSYKTEMAQLKIKLKRDTITEIVKRKIIASIQSIRDQLPFLNRLCKDESAKLPKTTPTPSATLAITPTATATATPSGCSQPCYNAQRRTACFGIPSAITGSESSGQQLWATCSGCHLESSRRNITYASIGTALSTIPQMLPFSSSFNNQDVADIAAYLNRFNTKQCKSDW